LRLDEGSTIASVTKVMKEEESPIEEDNNKEEEKRPDLS